MESLSAPNICVNCGKGEEDGDTKLKKCSACLSVKYCSAVCQKAHRPMHKKACKKRAAEIYDEKLFADPPPQEECPICMLPLPIGRDASIFKACCGKVICKGCICSMLKEAIGRGKIEMSQQLCPFCREPYATSQNEEIDRTKKLIESGNPYAYNKLGSHYAHGSLSLPRDYQKANELFLKGAQLGCAEAYYNLGVSYREGDGVEIDSKKSKYYFGLAAMDGHVQARHNLGCLEDRVGNQHRALKHFTIAAKTGDMDALESVKQRLRIGYLTKDEYANTLRVHLDRQKEMKSDMRDVAASIPEWDTITS